MGSCSWSDDITDRITSQTDFMLLVSAAPQNYSVSLNTSVAPGDVANAITGHRLSIGLTAVGGAAGAAVGAGFPGLRVTRGYAGSADFGMSDTLRRYISVAPLTTSGTSLQATAAVTVAAGLSGWAAMCFQASLGGSDISYISSQMECVDIIYSSRDEPTIRLEATQYQTGPSSFALRDGQTLTADLYAGLLAQDDVVTATLSSPLEGALLAPLNTGTNVARYGFSFAPSRAQTGSTVQICFLVSGLQSFGGPASEGQSCIQVTVERCIWSVREEESMLSIALDLKISWLQLWNFNKRIKRPDVELKPGMPINVGQLYTVQEGDTLTRIAAAFSTTVKHLIFLNMDLASNLPLVPGAPVCVAFAACTS